MKGVTLRQAVFAFLFLNLLVVIAATSRPERVVTDPCERYRLGLPAIDGEFCGEW